MIETEEEAKTFVRSLANALAIERLEQFTAELLQENQRQNLIASATETSVWTRHIADSGQLIPLVSRETRTWLDLGTGAGFPGLVIACLRPEIRMVLVESRLLRSDWLKRMVRKLDLANCQVKAGRVENLPGFEAEAISARAFAPMNRLLRLARRFSTKDTTWLLPKGRSAAQEINSLPKRVQSMFHVEQSLTSADAGIIVGRGLEAEFQ